MKLASFKGTKPGWAGWGNRFIRFRLKGVYSHSEIVFEPGDGVDHLMPDGTCQPDASGALWCASSIGLDIIPAWSRRRPGRRGGVRLKRIKLDTTNWDLVPSHSSALKAAQWARANEGALYDWQLVLGFVAWFFNHKESQILCHEACAEMLGIPNGWRLDPCSLHVVQEVRHRERLDMYLNPVLTIKD